MPSDEGQYLEDPHKLGRISLAEGKLFRWDKFVLCLGHRGCPIPQAVGSIIEDPSSSYSKP